CGRCSPSPSPCRSCRPAIRTGTRRTATSRTLHRRQDWPSPPREAQKSLPGPGFSTASSPSTLLREEERHGPLVPQGSRPARGHDRRVRWPADEQPSKGFVSSIVASSRLLGCSASRRGGRLQAGEILLPARLEARGGGLERRVATRERTRLGGLDALLELRAASRIRGRARRHGRRLLHGAGGDRGVERGLGRRVAGLARVGAVGYAHDVLADARARGCLEGLPAVGDDRLECGFRPGRAHLHAERRLAGTARIGTLPERRLAGEQRLPEPAPDTPAAGGRPGFRPVETGSEPYRAGAELIPAPRLLHHELHLAGGETRSRTRRVPAVLPLRPARVDALVVPLEAPVERVRE